MKKIISIITILLVIVFLGTGCGELPALSFSSHAWNKGLEPNRGTKEISHYTVKLNTDFNENEYDFRRDSKLPDTLQYDISGDYDTEIIVYSKSDAEIAEAKLDTEIIKDSLTDTVIYMHTLLNLTATYTVKGEVTTCPDTIESETYLLNTDKGLAPIRSIRKYRYSTVNANEEQKIAFESGLSEVDYFKTEYTVHNTTYDYTTGEIKNQGSFTEKYKYGTLIDYTTTLFALRNTALDQDKSTNIPAVSSVYLKYQTLGVKCYAVNSYITSLKYNGEDHDTVIVPAHSYEYRSNAQNSGRKQLAVIQSGTSPSGEIANRALLLKYVEPLTEYGSYLCLGALVYQLDSVQDKAL